jgi:thiol-disulfide isomerase/thioredoxin
MKKNFMMLCLLAAAMQSCGDKQKSAETTEAEAPAQEQAEAKAEEGVTAGAQAPDFNYKDISGKEVSLKTFQGKYVVLDFWGIWCKWCVKGIPDMKKYYDMYKEKMEIVSIDNGDEMDKLLRFPGVGRKIANLLRGDLFGLPAIVADTHCIRICGRLGFYAQSEKDPVRVEKTLVKLVEPAEQSDLCHRLVQFGRDVCSARAPKCAECPLYALCDMGGAKLKSAT